MPYKAPEPEAANFVSYLAANAAGMGARAAAPTGAAALSQLALRMKAKQQEQSYLAALQASQANQLAGTDLEQQGEIAKAYLPTRATAANAGILDDSMIAGNKYLKPADPNLALIANTNAQNQGQAAYLNKNMETVTGYMDSGIKPSDEYIAGNMTGAFEEKPVAIQSGYRDPEAEIKYM